MSSRNWILASAAVAAAAAGVLATSLASGTPAPIAVTATPGLQPAFSAGVSDYVTRCVAGTPVSVSVTVPPSTVVSVDGQAAQSASFTTTVPVTTGQGFTITSVSLSGGGSQTYFVRCLPQDFPNFTASTPGTPQAQFYLAKPGTLASVGPTPPPQYVAVFDTNGVPVWWYKDVAGNDAEPLANGTIATVVRARPAIRVRRLDGSLAASLDVVNTLGAPMSSTDAHDVQLLPNGDYLAIEFTTTQANLTPIGGAASATISDEVIQELTPTGQLVWSWDTAKHIPISEVAQQWWGCILSYCVPGPAGVADVYHMNSIQELGSNLLVSFRHLDAVYDINTQTGKIVWKLSGTHRSESLTVSGDSVFTGGGGFCGQHYARFVNGTTNLVSVHDNGTGCGRGPRGVEYQINTTAKTATLVQSVTDGAVTGSNCCGNAAKLPGGDWVASWGMSPVAEELNAAGVQQFHLQWTDPGTFTYRFEPILPGLFTIQQLRTGMNAQFPR